MPVLPFIRAEEFAVWLKGFLAASGSSLTVEQTAVIASQLCLVRLPGPMASLDFAAIDAALANRIQQIAAQQSAL